MTFRRIPRSVPEKGKPVEVAADGILLRWRDDPPSPVLSIYVGDDLVRQVANGKPVERVLLYVGEDADIGRIGLQFASRRDGDYVVSGHWRAARIYLPSHISCRYFSFAEPTAIPSSQIEVRGDMLLFGYSGIKA